MRFGSAWLRDLGRLASCEFWGDGVLIEKGLSYLVLLKVFLGFLKCFLRFSWVFSCFLICFLGDV